MKNSEALQETLTLLIEALEKIEKGLMALNERVEHLENLPEE